METEKNQLRIGELADQLGVKKFVIRFWEKEFGIKSPRTEGQQRLYSEKDVAFFQEIKSLLYAQGFTIAGAKKQLELQQTNQITPSEKTTLEVTEPTPIIEEQAKSTPAHNAQFTEQIIHIQQQLLKLRELLH